MKSFFKVLFSLALAIMPLAAHAGEPVQTDVKSTYTDVQKTLGLVPTFIRSYPEAGVSAAWEEMKSVQLNPNTALTGKMKELIGLGIAAQIPCKFCTYFHTEASRLNGANQREINEAIAIAAATRHWSTFLNGLQYDESDFRHEADKIISHAKDEMEKAKKGEAKPALAPIMVTDAQSCYQDVERTLGTVPGFIKMFPAESVAGAWKMMKSMQLNPETALSGKVKELIGLGVSAQIPCKFCTYFHTEAAKLNGATEREIRETLAMASVTRFWSTVLNGGQVDEATFKREVAQIMKHVKSSMEGQPGMSVKRAKK